MSKMIYVKVLADFNEHGDITPVSITWPDGHVFPIDRVIEVHFAPAKSGGSGVRYLCRIMGREVPLYYNETTWQWWCDGKD